jgi:hypothetical protein
MKDQVSYHIKEEVIRKWLSGEQRDKIASDMSMGAGTVTKIISEWKEEIGIPTADTFRILATELKRLNINASQCAKGYRLSNIINNFGAQEENIESFLTQIYKLCTSKNVPPEAIVNITQQIVALGETIPFSQIPEYMQQKIEEKQRLEQEIITLRETKLSAQNECDEALRSSNITIDTLHEYMRLRECLLEEYSLSIDDDDTLSKLINVISNLKHSGYDAKTITKKLSNINNLQNREKELQSQVDAIEVRLKRAEQDHSIAEEKLASSKQALGVYNELQNMGFGGLKELKLLKSTVLEISASNNIKPFSAVKKFFEDIKDQYDTKLGFERKIMEMNNSLFQAQQQHHNISLKYSQMKDTNDKLAELLRHGVTQDEIIYWTNILKDHKIEISSLHQDLVKYGTISGAYNNIAAKVDSLTSESNALTKKAEGLREEQRKISDVIEFQLGKCTKAIETFLNNIGNHINEVSKTSIQTIKNIKEQSLAIGEQSKIGLQFVNAEVNKQLEIFQMIGASAEFSPLIKAARGEIVDINELRISVIRALGIMTSRLDNVMYRAAKDIIDKAINILQSEWLFS